MTGSAVFQRWESIVMREVQGRNNYFEVRDLVLLWQGMVVPGCSGMWSWRKVGSLQCWKDFEENGQEAGMVVCAAKDIRDTAVEAFYSNQQPWGKDVAWLPMHRGYQASLQHPPSTGRRRGIWGFSRLGLWKAKHNDQKILSHRWRSLNVHEKPIKSNLRQHPISNQTGYMPSFW